MPSSIQLATGAAVWAILHSHLAVQVSATATYSLVRDYSGSSFFDRWTYYGKYDNLTNGDVTWVNSSVATSSPQLTYINDAGNAIIKVDNTSTVAYNYKRDSVRITSQDSYDVGSVWVVDALHLPYGCSVWPAFWSQGSDVAAWPAGGEIDVIEGVNNQVSNQMALHTSDGCTLTSSTTSYTGTTNSTNCYEGANDNSGCAISDGNSDSYGADFAAGGGGVWVTELASTGISIWFFSRSNVPSAVSNATSSIDTSSLGTPTGFWSSTSCAIDSFFSAQSLIFDITLCGSWAGTSSVLSTTGCSALSGSSTCYSTYVLDSSNYANAYFEIKSVKVYGNSTTSSSSSASGGMTVRNLTGRTVFGLLLAMAGAVMLL